MHHILDRFAHADPLPTHLVIELQGIIPTPVLFGIASEVNDILHVEVQVVLL